MIIFLFINTVLYVRISDSSKLFFKPADSYAKLLQMMLIFIVHASGVLVRKATILLSRHGIRTPFFQAGAHNISDLSRDRNKKWFADAAQWGTDVYQVKN